MKDRKIEEIVKNAGKNISNNDDTRYLQEYINVLANYIRKMKADHPYEGKEEIRLRLLTEMHNTSAEYCGCAYMQQLYYQYNAAKELSNNKEMIESLYQKIRSRGNLRKNFVYGINLKKNNENIVEEVCCELDQVKAMDIDTKEKTKQAIQKYQKMSEKEKREYNKKNEGDMDLTVSVFTKDEVSTIQYYIQNHVLPTYEELIKEQQEAVFKILFNEFSKYGLLDKYLKQYNNSLANIDLKDLQYDMSTGKVRPDEVGLQEIFSEDFLREISVDKIMQLSVFWQNRYAKETESINNAFFAIDTLNLWDTILNTNQEITISQEKGNGVNAKINCVKPIVSRLISHIEEKYKDELNDEESIKRGYKPINPKNEIDFIVNQEGNNYHNHFQKIVSGSENDLREDIESYRTLHNLTENTYKVRNSMFTSQIQFLAQDKHVKNWGIVRNEYDGYGTHRNTDKENYALIYIDYEGFNMPLKLHIRRAKLIEALKLTTGTPIIPEYLGNEDFIVYGNLIKNNVYMPMLKRHKKAISNRYNKEKNSSKYRLISHLRYLKDKSNGRFPIHLMEQEETSKGVIYKRPKKRYFNLETCEELYLEDGKYVQVEQEGGKQNRSLRG